MIPYVFLLAGIFLLGLIGRELAFAGKDLTGPLLAIGCAGIALMAALRSPTVGADTSNYQNFFVWISSFPFDQVAMADTFRWNAQGTEVTYKFFNKFVSLVSADPQAITMASSIALGLGLYLLISRQSGDPWVSLLLFVTLGLFQTSMNVAPSSLAAVYSLIGFEFIQKRNLKLFLLCIAAGCLFHYSALLFLPFYVLARLRFPLRRVVVALVVCFTVMPVAYPFIVSIVSMLVPARWAQYLTVSRVNISQLIVWVLYAFVFLVAAAAAGKNKDGEAVNRANLLFLVVGVAYALTLFSTSFSRLAILFSFSFVVTIPTYLSRTNERYLNGHSFKLLPGELLARVHANHIKSVVVVVSAAVFLARLFVNNVGLTLPYELFF